MRTFGGFRSGEEFFYGEVRGEDVHVLAKPYWIEITPTGDMRKLADLHVDVPVAPSKLIAVGLNYSDHIAEMKRTPLGTPLIWFKAPSSLLPHGGTIEIAFPEHRTDFEVELAIVIGAPAKNVSVEGCARVTFSVTPSAWISAIATCKKAKSNLAAANHSTLTHRLARSCILMSMLVIFRSNCGKTARPGSGHARVR